MVSVDMGDYTWLMVVGCIIAFGAAMGIGANDAANSFATSVGSKTLKLWHAVIICAIFEFSGAVFMGSHVSDTVRKGITSYKHFKDDPEVMMLGMFCVLIAVAFWLALATKLELPVSTTHSAIGGVVGMTIVAKGWDAVIWTKVWGVVASWFISPALSAAAAVVFWAFIRFGLLQVYPCCKAKESEAKTGCKKCTPYLRTVAFYPVVVGVTFGVQTFYIIYKGSPQLKLKTTPLWMAIVIAIGVGFGTAAIGAMTIPALMTLAEWRFARKNMEKEAAAVSAMEGGATEMTVDAVISTVEEKPVALEGGADDEPTKTAPEAEKDAANGGREAEGETDSTEENIEEQFADRPKLGEIVKLVDTVDIWQSATEVTINDFAIKSKNLAQFVMTDKLKMDQKQVEILFPADDEFDIHGVGQESEVVQRIHGNLERFDEKAEATFSFLQILSACVDAFGHGANDVANAIAPLAAMYGIWDSGEISKKTEVPIWILALGGAGIVVGLMLFGHKIIRAIGVKLVAITPSRGFTVELGSATVVILASRLGWPVSTTHCQVGAEIGIGFTDGLWPRVLTEEEAAEDETDKKCMDKSFMLGGKKRKCWMCYAINWVQLAGVLFGWVITVVIAAFTAGLSFYVLYHTPYMISCKGPKMYAVNGTIIPGC